MIPSSSSKGGHHLILSGFACIGNLRWYRKVLKEIEERCFPWYPVTKEGISMALKGKNIDLYLMDGTITGRIKCTLSNWTGVAYRIPRTDLDLCNNRSDLKQSGVYFLFGVSDKTEKNKVYVGQAGLRKNGEGLLMRLKEHVRNTKEFYWTEAIVFTTSNNSFGPTEISYLENRFCTLATTVGRYEVENSNDPTHGNVTEEKESELEEFIDSACIMMGALGHKVFEPLLQQERTPPTEDAVHEPVLSFARTNMTAKGQRTSDGFVVFKGSAIAKESQKSCPKGVQKLRENAKVDSNNCLLEDMLFSSPSAAAAFVGGSSLSGNAMWKTEDGKTLGELEKAES